MIDSMYFHHLSRPNVPCFICVYPYLPHLHVEFIVIIIYSVISLRKLFAGQKHKSKSISRVFVTGGEVFWDLNCVEICNLLQFAERYVFCLSVFFPL